MADRKHEPSIFPQRRFLGAGRSARVYLAGEQDGFPLVDKVFCDSGLSRIVLLLFTGAGNPYFWCPQAITAALRRRELLQGLVHYWFGNRLRLPKTLGSHEETNHSGFTLTIERIHGRHARLELERRDPQRLEICQLRQLMTELQQRLFDCGGDGLLWQAGYGNPVATSNFMLETAKRQNRWVWIDLESGVPALFAFDLRTSLRHYLPACWKHRSWLFDDIDLNQLQHYIDQQGEPLKACFSQQGLDPPEVLHAELAQAQKGWKDQNRVEAGINYARYRGQLTAAQADHYRQHPLQWNLHALFSLLQELCHKLPHKLHQIYVRLAAIDLPRQLRLLRHYFSSQAYRRQAIENYANRRLGRWYQRGFLSRRLLLQIRQDMRTCPDGEYLGDFSIHLAIKPLIKFLQWILVPLLFSLDLISSRAFFLLFPTLSPMARTIYTLYRSLISWQTGRPIPWIALAFGTLPVAGNFAYPLQLIYCSGQRQLGIARFLLLDAWAAIGRKLPIWGGMDTRWEHDLLAAGKLLATWVIKLRRKAHKQHQPSQDS